MSPMDDRLAKLLLENNLLQRQQSDERRLSLLEKLATNGLAFEPIPIPGVIITPSTINAEKLKSVFLSEEFTGHTGTGGESWDLNWKPGTSTSIEDVNALFFTGYLASILPYCPGIIRITSSAVDAYIILYNPLLIANLFDFVQFVAFCDQTLTPNEGYIFGLTPDPALSTFEIDGSSEGIYFKYEFGDGNWQTVTRDGGGITQTDTGIPFDAASPQIFFEIKRSTTDTFQFYINEKLVATHTTNISTLTLQPIWGSKMNAPGSWYIYLDYFALQITPFTQRWT